jgi:hypothetical protein
VPRAPEEISPWICLCSAGHSVGFPFTPTRHIVSRETLNSLSIHLSRSLYSGSAPHAIFYQIASYLSGQGLYASRLLLPHRRAGPRDSAKWGSVPESCGILVLPQERARGRGRMESAAALIGSQLCDVFIACLGCREGAGDNWVGSRERWWLY